MPLSSEHIFGVKSLTESINKLPNTPHTISNLKLFKSVGLTTTYVEVEQKGGELTLVQNQPRGAAGTPVKDHRDPPKVFKTMHLVKDDVVRADDVQNLRAFGSQSQTVAVAELVNDKLVMMKADIDYTREHAKLGALKGKILDSDGSTVITDIYKEFGLTRTEHQWQLTNTKTNVHSLIDTYKLQLAKLRRGETVNGYVCLVSPAFMDTLINHPMVRETYLKYDPSLYVNASTDVSFTYKGVQFVVYADEFESGLKIADDEGIILPTGTRQTFFEYFAPADMNSTVNTKGLPYYASREQLKHDKGWELHAQSNPLPLILRPELVQTIKLV